ncbi:MAG: site-2 protease family protein [Candidatus Aenigmarchaeota archaeon]|nr:site-2 protease family protein [Candidatus Aenigmarchaeota archaeon]
MHRKTIFSGIEARDIVISLMVLAIVFSYPEFLSRPESLVVSILILGVAFMGHELSHKFSARRFGYWAEYRMWAAGLGLALVMAIATSGNFIFAAPGAVMFGASLLSVPKKKDVGKIGLAGPAFNIISAAILIAAFLAYPARLLLTAVAINSWLAVFNLIPVPPLDGQKVFSWSKVIWAAAITIAGAELAFVFLG